MELRILGQLEVMSGGTRVALGGPKQRAVLAMLVLGANQPVSVDRLVDCVWGESPPPAAVATLHGYVARLRRALQPDRSPGAPGNVLVTEAGGYTLQVDADRIDAFRFERLAGEGRTALQTGDAQRAADLLDEALALWRGPVLADLAFDAVHRHAARLEELRRTAEEERLDAYLALGREDEVVADAERLVVDGPLRERPRGQLMLALYRQGRQADALRAYKEFRTVLREELGLDPGPALQELEGAVLRQDPALERPRSGAPAPAAAGGDGQSTGERSNLPQPLTSFVGRDQDLRELRKLLETERLLTLLGPGGVGKTRLALEVASRASDDHPDGVWFVDLAPLTDPLLVTEAMATALGIQEDPGRPLAASVVEYSRHRRLLLVVDNCEHMVHAVATIVDQLLRACADVRVLATSRESLGVDGEISWWVPALSVPDPTQASSLPELMQHDSVRLFLTRAAAVRADLRFEGDDATAVAQVCAGLEGMPLALELAAARVGVLHVSQISARLGDRFRLLTTGPRTVAPRQQTLRAAVDWSYDLLDSRERALLARLSVFHATFTLDAAEAVCGMAPAGPPPDVLDLLASLVGKSLVVMEAAQGQASYRLYETIREYAAEKLAEGGDVAELLRRHRDFYLGLARSHVPVPPGGVELMVADTENFRAALQWSLDNGHVEETLDLVRALVPFWISHGHLRDAVRLLRRSVELARNSSEPGSCPPDVLLVLADLEGMLGHYDEAAGLYDEVRRRTNAAPAWRGLVSTFRKRGRHGEALELIDQAAVALDGGDEGLGILEHERGRILLVAGRFAEAAAALERSLALVGSDASLSAESLLHLARAQIPEGKLDAALANALRANALFERHDDVRGLVVARRVLGGAYESLDRLEEAADTLRAGLGLAERLDNVEELGACLVNLGLVEAKRGRLAEAIACDRRAVEQFERIGHGSGRAISYGNLAEKLAAAGVHEEALVYCDRALDIAQQLDYPMTVGEASQTKALVFLARKEPAQAAQLAEAAAETFAGIGALPAAAAALDLAADALAQAGLAAGSDVLRARAGAFRAGQANC